MLLPLVPHCHILHHNCTITNTIQIKRHCTASIGQHNHWGDRCVSEHKSLPAVSVCLPPHPCFYMKQFFSHNNLSLLYVKTHKPSLHWLRQQWTEGVTGWQKCALQCHGERYYTVLRVVFKRYLFISPWQLIGSVPAQDVDQSKVDPLKCTQSGTSTNSLR